MAPYSPSILARIRSRQGNTEFVDASGSPFSSIHTRSGSGSTDNSAGSRSKYTLFPPPDPSLEPNLPLLMAAKAVIVAKSVPNLKTPLESGDAFNSQISLVIRTPSKSETAIKEMMKKLSQQGEYKQRSVSFKIQEKLKRLISKKSVSPVISCTSDGYCVLQEATVRTQECVNLEATNDSKKIPRMHMPGQSFENAGLSAEALDPDFHSQKSGHKVIRRVKSEADFSPKISRLLGASGAGISKDSTTSLSSITSAAIGDPPTELPPTPAHRFTKKTHLKDPFVEFPQREDSLGFSTAFGESSNTERDSNLLKERLYIRTSRGDKTLSRISLATSQELSFMEDGLVVRQRCLGDDSYQDSLRGPPEDDIIDAYSTFGDENEQQSNQQPSQSRYSCSESNGQTATPDLSFSSIVHEHRGTTELESPTSSVQSSVLTTASPASSSGYPSRYPLDEPEVVEREILDDFIDSLAQRGSPVGKSRRSAPGALQSPQQYRRNTQLHEKSRIENVHMKLSDVVTKNKVLDFGSTLGLGEFVLRSLDGYLLRIGGETQKTQRQRSLLQEQKSRLASAISDAERARETLETEKKCLEIEKEEVLRHSLKLATIFRENPQLENRVFHYRGCFCT
ncbi:hypothetical protein BDZ91DRAFT_825267 [Kalaharituber pfeilii]|nr:hypothetical protein BDZ91DRAFT_825267 [Kalaharituber pfeilii]